jgi:hypothetical protein
MMPSFDSSDEDAGAEVRACERQQSPLDALRNSNINANVNPNPVSFAPFEAPQP